MSPGPAWPTAGESPGWPSPDASATNTSSMSTGWPEADAQSWGAQSWPQDASPGDFGGPPPKTKSRRSKSGGSKSPKPDDASAELSRREKAEKKARDAMDSGRASAAD